MKSTVIFLNFSPDVMGLKIFRADVAVSYCSFDNIFVFKKKKNWKIESYLELFVFGFWFSF